MKKTIFIIIFPFLLLTAQAQQEVLFSQYMFNGLALNPAYAGSNEVLSFTALYRKQWVGLDGAPETQTVSFHTPLRNEKIGLGLQIFHDKIGIFNRNGAYGSYAFHLPTTNGAFSIGLQGGITSYQARWADEVTISPGDNAFANNSETMIAPNVGFGLYYRTQKYYAGVSIPYLLENNLDFNNNVTNASKRSHQFRHYFLSGGYVIALKPDIQLKPEILLKYVQNAPTQLDINLTALFYNSLWVGGGFRTDGSVVLLLEYQLNKQFSFGYSFDLLSNPLRKANSGSHEIMVRYEFSFDKSNLAHPRYF